uniref:Uncharacterized protein n=1 Tax=Cyclopterus lumpus TaxID=8103 RepID=A0A8C2ZCB0_CYCLU
SQRIFTDIFFISYLQFFFAPKGNNRCKDLVDDKTHEIGSSWINSRCHECTCDRCCHGCVHRSQHLSFLICKNSRLRYSTVLLCVCRLFKRDNPTVQCPIFSAVGK